jgi:hypothetical protein
MGFTLSRGRWGGRASERAGARDLALDEALDIAQDVPGKRAETTPKRPWSTPTVHQQTWRKVSPNASAPNKQTGPAASAPKPPPTKSALPPIDWQTTKPPAAAQQSTAMVKYKAPTYKATFKAPVSAKASPVIKATGRARPAGPSANPAILQQMVNAAREYQKNNQPKQQSFFGGLLGRRNQEPRKKDAKGVVLEGDQAFYNGLVVRPGGTYAPRGVFGGSKGKPRTYFVVDRVKWHNDRIIAVGTLFYADTFNLATMLRKEHKWYYVTDLRAAENVEHHREGILL